MDEKDLLSRIERDPEIMFGKPVIKGTRLPADLIMEKLAHGYTEEALKKEYPFITGDDIKAVMLFAAKVLSLETEFSTT